MYKKFTVKNTSELNEYLNIWELGYWIMCFMAMVLSNLLSFENLVLIIQQKLVYIIYWGWSINYKMFITIPLINIIFREKCLSIDIIIIGAQKYKSSFLLIPLSLFDNDYDYDYDLWLFVCIQSIKNCL